jgi:hypothetical protein
MLKHFYLFAWVLLAIDVFNSVYKGTINPISILIYSFITFALLYVLGIWLSFFQTEDKAMND